MLFFQFLLNGILIGGLYALLALGIVLICKATRVFNFALGEMLALGAFILYTFLTTLHLPLWLALPGSVLIIAASGLAMERLALRPLIGQPILAAIMATLALSLMLRGLVLFYWGSSIVSYPKKLVPARALVLGDIYLANELIWTFVISLACFLALLIFFRFTKSGLFMRATAEGHDTAQAAGVNVERVFSMTWAIAALIAGVGGIMLGNRFGIGITTLPVMAIKAFPAVLFGGLESMTGAIVGGLVIGIVESLVGGYLNPQLSEIAPYIILLLILLIRPEGLFGLKRIERI
jgi:branched-chain amino acid transport system permease protein